MFFSRDSLYGWGVCRIPMPRSAVDQLTDRRKRTAGAGIPDRRAGETSRGEELTALLRILRDDVPWGKSLLACSLILGLLLLLGRLAPAPVAPVTPLTALEITVQLKPEPPPRPVPAAAPLSPSPLATLPLPPAPAPLSEAAAEPLAVVPQPAAPAPAAPELLPAPVLPRYEPPPAAPAPQRLPESSRLQPAATEIDLAGPTGVSDYRQKSLAAAATLPEQAPQLAAAQRPLELEGPRPSGFSPPPAATRPTEAPASGTTFAPAAPSRVELPRGPGAPQPARPLNLSPARGLPGSSQPSRLAEATPEVALPAPGQRLAQRTRPAAPAAPALPGGAAPAFAAVRASDPLLPAPTPAGRPGSAVTAPPATTATTTSAVTLPRREEVDPRYLVDLNTVRECSGQDDEIGLKTQLATLLQREGTCLWQGSVFYFSRPDSAYSLQVQLYNAAGFPYNNRCEGYRQAIRCVKSQRP